MAAENQGDATTLTWDTGEVGVAVSRAFAEETLVMVLESASLNVWACACGH